MSEQRRPSVGFWSTVVVASLPLLYVLSFGPACGLVNSGKLPDLETAKFYRPLVRAATCEFWPVAFPLHWYGEVFAPDETRIYTGKSFSVVDFMNLLLLVSEVEGG